MSEIKRICDLVILYSGGADSTLLLELAKDLDRMPHCIMIDYGQVHKEELIVAQKQLEERGLSYQTISIGGLNVNSGLTGDLDTHYEGVHERHVPGRNSIFLSLALSVAESKGIKTIWIGADWSDRINLFPDCYQEYYVKINELFKIAGSKEIKVEAPLIGMSKEMILDLLDFKYNISSSKIYSGYGNH